MMCVNWSLSTIFKSYVTLFYMVALIYAQERLQIKTSSQKHEYTQLTTVTSRSTEIETFRRLIVTASKNDFEKPNSTKALDTVEKVIKIGVMLYDYPLWSPISLSTTASAVNMALEDFQETDPLPGYEIRYLPL